MALMSDSVSHSLWNKEALWNSLNLGSSTLTTWYQEQASETTRCLPMETSNPKVDSLSESLLAFRFPTDKTTVRISYRKLPLIYMYYFLNTGI